MKIAIGCDPNAEEAKQEIIAYIEKKGYILLVICSFIIHKHKSLVRNI